MPNTLTITLLGSPQVILNGRSLHFPSVKATALLAYLAVSGMLHNRAELAALLWPESDNKRARGALRYTLSLLKKEMGDGFLLITRREIGMDPEANWEADVVTIRHLLSAALGPEDGITDEMWRNAAKGVSLYHADFLQGFTLRDSDNFNAWTFIQSEALRRDLATVLKRLSARHQEEEQWETAVSITHRWLNLDPLHEPAHRQLIQLYADSGEWTAVHNQYQSLTDLLETDLGVPPQAETTTLYQQLCQLRETVTEPVETAVSRAPLTPDQRIRHVLIEKMRRFWVNSLLTPLRDEQTFIHLKLECMNDTIDHPWADVPHAQQNQDAANIYRAFRNADRSLLILGAPGAGKTINLVELAAYLLAMADDDEHQPVPVILNLSRWAGKQIEIGAWAIEEMVAKYQIPRRIGRKWLAEDKLLLLLDGLDEMPPDCRPDCITAINAYRQQHGLADIVVCCRQEAYETAVSDTTRLQLNGAVLVRPLTTDQIRQHAPSSLVETIFADETLLEIAQSPLNLNMMEIALNGNNTRSITRTTLFDHYVQRMFQRQKRKESDMYSDEEMSAQLTWLAQQMQRHNQSIFLIEQLQPSWLENACIESEQNGRYQSNRFQWLYLFLTRAILTALFGTIMLWSFIQLTRINPPPIQINFLSSAAALFGVTTAPWNDLLSIFMLIACTGTAVSVVDYLFFTQRRRRGTASRINRRGGWVHLAATGGSAWVTTTALVSLTDTWALAIFLGSLSALTFGWIFGYLTYGQSFRTEISSRSALAWSWRNSILLGVLGGLLSLAWSVIVWLQDPTLVYWVTNSFTIGTIFFLLGGISGKRIETRNRPNEGIRIAAKNSLKAAVFLFVPISLLVTIVVNPLSGLLNGLMYGILAGMIYGFNDVLKHLVVRLLLWSQRRIPLNYAHFLDCAADCVLLQKVGGGYTFRHRLLQDYFANGSTPPLPMPSPAHQPTPPLATIHP